MLVKAAKPTNALSEFRKIADFAALRRGLSGSFVMIGLIELQFDNPLSLPMWRVIQIYDFQICVFQQGA